MPLNFAGGGRGEGLNIVSLGGGEQHCCLGTSTFKLLKKQQYGASGQQCWKGCVGTEKCDEHPIQEAVEAPHDPGGLLLVKLHCESGKSSKLEIDLLGKIAEYRRLVSRIKT